MWIDSAELPFFSTEEALVEHLIANHPVENANVIIQACIEYGMFEHSAEEWLEIVYKIQTEF
ncbi:MAG: hypothetical protein NTW79_02485 [Candidatus Berkelbacteria bacterium]|nr:hypothetical protein [Candidatus Berkelbacteria bacterium]